MKVLIIGAGPSLDRNLAMFRRTCSKGGWKDIVIIAVDAALPRCLKASIIPQYVATLEDYPDYMKFFDNDLVR